MTARAVRVWHSRASMSVLLVFGLLAMSVVAGTLVVSEPTVALLPVAALAASYMMVDARARIAFVLFGGLFLLQTTAGLESKKLAFLAGVGVAVLGAFVTVQRRRGTRSYLLARPLLAASLAVVALIAVSFPVAYTNGIPPKEWLRAVAPYLLFASVPIFALDAQAAIGMRKLVRLLVVVGTLGAVAFAVGWLNRRGIAHLPISRLAASTLFVPAALFSYAMSSALQRSARRTQWLLLAGCVLALLIATSTRSSLALVVAPLAIAFGARRQLTPRSVRLFLLAPLAAALTLAVAGSVIITAGADTSVLHKRIETFESTGNAEKDSSYTDRLTQAGVAWDAFTANPLAGAGAGTAFEWKPQGLPTRSSPILDTPVTFPAKFGLLGLAVAFLVIANYWSFTRSLARRGEPRVAQLALVGYLAVVAVLAVLADPLEDKGLSLGLILLLALVLREAETEPTPRESAGLASDVGSQ
jgi:O-antigen ligase